MNTTGYQYDIRNITGIHDFKTFFAIISLKSSENTLESTVQYSRWVSSA